ncbi:hypothetical protein [Arthrobacter sp. Alg241-R88]|uniref:hypothetical protein n=1 Tax=Arthrobacter sp. Alg241-R88 TaxID=2305984 RepID=UPI0019687A92|nr:hypothetical protein [Arthrobacter sp. Alg241-R88]
MTALMSRETIKKICRLWEALPKFTNKGSLFTVKWDLLDAEPNFWKDHLNMRFITSTVRQTRPGARRATLAATSAIFAAMFVVLPTSAAQAHHGFDDFDTDRLYYISGAVSQVR